MQKRRGASRGGRSSAASGWGFAICGVLLLVSLAANVLQYTSEVDARNRRLYSNLTRPSVEDGKRVGDINLKTLSLSQQVEHPAGISTEEFTKLWRFDDFSRRYEFIDVRTPEEYEMGSIAGATHIVQPDLRLNKETLLSKSKPFILICESGNRSGELCADLIEDGYTCQFLVGGFSKWVSEGRPSEGLSRGNSSRARDIADYPRKEVLLDTPEVQDLVTKRQAIFVDVRYPGDFELSHLPGAFNFPIRKMTSSDWENALKILPKDKPIIAACYDKRSCFYSLLIGLRLTRANREYLGRYTVPHEYIHLDSQMAYEKQWRETNEQTFFSLLSQPLEAGMTYIEGHSPSYLAAIIFFVLALRILFLPFTLKSDRDQYIQRSQADALKEIKTKYADDPERMSRATMRWYKSNKITPIFNLCGSLIQLTAFLLAFFVIQGHAKNHNESFLWLDSPSSIDTQYYILSAILGFLLFALMQSNAKESKRLTTAFHIIGALVIVAITLPLVAAVNFYLCVNVALLLLQSFILSFYFSLNEKRASEESLEDPGVLALNVAHRVEGSGNKAGRLGKLMTEGLPVPDGVVVTEAAFEKSGSDSSLPPERKKEIEASLRRIGGDAFAVRSSGAKEDGEDQSYAGVFDSLLNVALPKVDEAIREVHRSLYSERSQKYSGEDAGGGAVLIQEMVAAEYAGVMFTEHPSESGSFLIELTKGLGDALVSGETDASAYRYGRASLALLDDNEPPIPLRQLVELGTQIEKIFGKPQDIEWAYYDEQFHILQARDITVLSRNGEVGEDMSRLFEKERHKLMELAKGAAADEIVLQQNELSEILPNPTPLSLSFINRFFRPGGTADLACRELGFPYDVPEESADSFTTVFGSLYSNRLEESKRVSKSIGALASYRMARNATSIEHNFRNEFLPPFLKQIDTLMLVDVSKLEQSRLVSLLEEWIEHFITETYVEAEIINVAAEFYLRTAETELRKNNLNPAAFLADIPATETLEALSMLPDIREGKRSVSEFIERYGHRAYQDFELSQPRFYEKPEILNDFIENFAGRQSHTNAKQELPDSRLLKAVVKRAQDFQALKEDAKHFTLKELAFIRLFIVELGKRWDLGDDIFYLTLDEVFETGNSQLSSQLRTSIEERKRSRETFVDISLPIHLTPRHLESIDFAGSNKFVTSNPLNAALAGLLVAGNKEISGTARVITKVEDITSFQPGEILVTRFTSPEWTPIFANAQGIITEVGGWLSHAAILAREYNLTTTVGVVGAMDMIRTGDQIRICLDGRIEQV
jgi:YidC/Oxa1 family membrane protein insertase